MAYPLHRARRLRAVEPFRRLMRETALRPDGLIMPVFVSAGRRVKQPLADLPGVYRYSVDVLTDEAQRIKDLGIPALLLFGVPAGKDAAARNAYRPDGPVQQAVRRLKAKVAGLAVITDVCLCSYTPSGHCGIVKKAPGKAGQAGGFEIDNDATLAVLARIALSHAQAGADCVAPSAMMDGQVKTLRAALDQAGFAHIPIMAYSTKFASSFYGPFRTAADCAPKLGDRQTYQLDGANAAEAVRETQFDIEEGADIVMVKPALAYLDIIRRLRETCPAPLAAYSVSGEYAMIKAAAGRNLIDERQAVLEIMTAIKRAGADMIITYYARNIADWLRHPAPTSAPKGRGANAR